MKQKLSLLTKLTFTAILTIMLHSCTPEENSFDETILYGKWQEGTLFEKYNSNGTGSTWDTADDVSEEEAQLFTWTLVTNRLTQVHKLEMGGDVPKVYSVITLTESLLVYEDDYGKRHTFIKVTQ